MKEVENTQPVKRRDFLKTAWVALGGLVALEFSGLSLAYMQPRIVEGEFGSVISAGKVDDFPVGSVTHIPNGRFYLSRLQDGGFVALYQRCTHLGCNVPWDQNANAFICPCHNSKFSPDGTLINPPAPRSLDIFNCYVQDGNVLVDTSTPITRQTNEMLQVVYP